MQLSAFLRYSGNITTTLNYLCSTLYFAFLLGFEWHGIQIKVSKPDIEIEEKLRGYLHTNKKVIFYYQYSKSGMYDFDIGIAIKKSEELREFVNELRT